MTAVRTFEEYVTSLAAVAPQQAAAEPDALELCAPATAKIATLCPLDRTSLAKAVAQHPEIVPVLAAAANFSQERFKTWLQARFGTAGWMTLGRTRAADLIGALDDDFSLLALLEAQVAREWTWADALARVMAPRQRAGSAIKQGRALEDDVEAVIWALRLPFAPRTRFEGTGDRPLRRTSPSRSPAPTR